MNHNNIFHPRIRQQKITTHLLLPFTDLHKKPVKKIRSKKNFLKLSYSEFSSGLNKAFTRTQHKVANFMFQLLSLHQNVFVSEEYVAEKNGCSVKTVSETITKMRYYDLLFVRYRYMNTSLYSMGFYFKKINDRLSLSHVFSELKRIPVWFLENKNLFSLNKLKREVYTSNLLLSVSGECILRSNTTKSFTARAREEDTQSPQHQEKNNNQHHQGHIMDKKRRLLEGYLRGKVQELPIMEEVKALRLPYTDNQIMELQQFSVPTLTEASHRMQRVRKTGNTFAYFKATCKGIALEKKWDVDEQWLLDLNSLWSADTHAAAQALRERNEQPITTAASQPSAPHPISDAPSPHDSKEKHYTANTSHGTKRLRSLDEIVQSMSDAQRTRFLDTPWKELEQWERVDILQMMNRERRLFNGSSPMMQHLERRKEADSTDAELLRKAREVYHTVKVPWKVLDEWLMEYTTKRTICGKPALRETVQLLQVYLEERAKFRTNSPSAGISAYGSTKDIPREQKLNPESDLKGFEDPLYEQAQMFSERWE